MKRAALILIALAVACSRQPETTPTPEPAATVGEGAFFAVSADAKEGKLLVTLPAPDADGVMLRAIHSAGLSAGLGSNPVGLDRGYADEGKIIAFRRVGEKVIVEKENWAYRASADNPLEKKAVANSFARSFLWAGNIAEEKPDGSLVIDLGGFLTGDILDLKGVLKAAGQGSYAVDADRSFPDYSSVLVFPDNVELDAFLTLSGDTAGDEVSATAADGRSFTLTVHHSFVRLPAPGFHPRGFDARSGAIDVPYYDFSAPLSASIRKSFARRFRLERVDPAAASGPVKKPIVFYVDSGAPEPVRSALMEGAGWWAEAFRAAGFEDAYRVELLPEGAHPLDTHYNVIQWVHRQTRGWSYGGGVYDPRTGEMLKANVVLGSQRVRQDRMIFEGLAGADKTGTGSPDDPVEIALARIRQLAAHEVGHTLGFAHNFAASVNDRASVMDYPAPLVTVAADGALDFSKAYSVGVGAWDKVAARWLYGEFPQNEKAELDKILTDAYAAGLKFVDDPQARGVSTANPWGSVWDNGADSVASLRQTMQVRAVALANFGERSLKPGEPTSELRAVIVPVYLYHRYQVAAAAKLIGGYDFKYAVKGDPGAAGSPVAADRQRAALAAIVATLDPAFLDLPDATLDRLTPALASFGPGSGGQELFDAATGPMFDLTSAADAAAAESMNALFSPPRLARLVETRRRNETALAPEEVFAAVETAVFAPATAERQAEIARTLQTRFVSTLIDLASAEKGSLAVQARADAYLRTLRSKLAPGIFSGVRPSVDQGHRAFLAARIDAYLNRAAPAAKPSAPDAEVPPGSPIGSAMGEDCWFCDLR